MTKSVRKNWEYRNEGNRVQKGRKNGGDVQYKRKSEVEKGEEDTR